MLDVLSSLAIPQIITTDSYVSLTFHLQNSFLICLIGDQNVEGKSDFFWGGGGGGG